jgi:hypothetical protein
MAHTTTAMFCISTIQLCIHDGLHSQRAVCDIVGTSRKSVVGHFKYSSAASSRLNLLLYAIS